MSRAIDNFYDALQRLIEGKPKIIVGSYSINNDTVAIEAGRQRGTIKKSRSELADLLIAIAEAEQKRTGHSSSGGMNAYEVKLQAAQDKIEKLESKLQEIQDKYDKQLAQLNTLSFRNLELQRKVQKTNTSENQLLDFIR
ncbi:hypothetical protein PFCIP103579_2397 [Prolinoborus fasciculus]|uniref:Uncharacterized protein n=1 Tax=Acinetobacter lwoffii TaxID=28090 RepID=A0A6N1MWH6_ACILW|nr:MULTISPECIES: hypothetical protein [Pseudomonadota]ENW31391.1 hypothetical protein F924_00234 [Acinetobacter lwoffii ATCC 9957 = CIP 70.31]QKU22851.1 hypothetical protein FOB19_16510 [Acinetobacter lwoffii]SPJ21253.1 hypothetical protein PFCIP103579_2397 [Prolinoborus fasciculus]